MTGALLWQNGLVIAVLMTTVWVLSVIKRDASIADPFWSINFLCVTLYTAVATGLTPAKLLLLTMVTLWALRLCVHLLHRSRGKPEDPRYAAFRKRFGPERYWWFSFFQVFVLQGALAWFISAPLQLAASSTHESGAISPLDLLSAAVFATGFIIEVVADAQLAAHRRDPNRKGKVLDRGLWRYSRHPNYFGDALLWWGLWLNGLDEPLGALAIVCPLLMTYLLVKVSGVSMLDEYMARTKPGYADYMKRTSGFIPRPPRQVHEEA